MHEAGLTIILPAAGLGVRLGVDGPKELVEIDEGFPMIAFSLRHVLAGIAGKRFHLRVSVVIRKGKEAVVDYVRSVLPENVEVITVYFDPQLKEWPGSIHSAKETFSEYNFVLLPDSFIGLSKENWLRNPEQQTLIELAATGLEHARAVFGTVACRDCERLRHLGAVKQDEAGRITAFQDKPADPESYNAFWGCFAFRRGVADALHEFLIASVMHENPNYPGQPFYPARSFPLNDYADLGTWDSINAFQAKYSAEALGFTDFP